MTAPIILPIPGAQPFQRELSREEKRLQKQETKRKKQEAQSATVRIVNLSEDFPHIVLRQSVWYIANPRNGTQFVKVKRQYPLQKHIRDSGGRVTSTISKTQTETSLGMKIVDEATGEQKVLFPTIVKVDAFGKPMKKTSDMEAAGFDQLTWPVPKGFKPLIVPNSNYVDLPPDAANLILNGEYRGPNPQTMMKDLRYHNGDLVPLTAAHELADAIYSGKSKELMENQTINTELARENERLERAIAAKMKELDALNVAELLAKKKEAATGKSTTPDSANPPSK